MLFSGVEVTKTNDEAYPFYTDRDFLYLTGLDAKEFVFAAGKDADGQVWEKVYILPPDPMKERWTGTRIRATATGRAVIPLYQAIGVDPGMFGSVLAIDMGGYQMAQDSSEPCESVSHALPLSGNG